VTEIDFDQFDDEMQTMHELMDECQIALSDDTLGVPISTLALKPAVVVPLGTSMQQCIGTMVARHFGCLLIVDQDKICGIFTERDALLRVAGQRKEYKTLLIDEFMTRDPATLQMHDTIESALLIMNQGGYRHIAIVREDNLPIAVLSVKDIVGYLIDFFPQDVLNLPPHPIRIGTKNQYGA